MTGPFYLLAPTVGDPDTMTPVAVSDVLLQEIETGSPLGAFGVTIDEVFALVPSARRVAAEDIDDDGTDSEGRYVITEEQVGRWVLDVTAFALGRLGDWTPIVDPTRRDHITQVARAAVVNGAASWLAAARFEGGTGVQDPEGYPAVLWDRFLAALTDLAALIGRWRAEAITAAASAVSLAGTGAFPPPMFPDPPRVW